MSVVALVHEPVTDERLEKGHDILPDLGLIRVEFREDRGHHLVGRRARREERPQHTRGRVGAEVGGVHKIDSHDFVVNLAPDHSLGIELVAHGGTVSDRATHRA